MKIIIELDETEEAMTIERRAEGSADAGSTRASRPDGQPGAASRSQSGADADRRPRAEEAVDAGGAPESIRPDSASRPVPGTVYDDFGDAGPGGTGPSGTADVDIGGPPHSDGENSE